MKKKSLLLILLMVLLAPWAANAQGTLTVHDGTVTNRFVPIDGYNVDGTDIKSEYIMPASELAAMTGMDIAKMKLYLQTVGNRSWGTATFRVFLKEVENTTISSFSGYSDATVVYLGALDCLNEEMEITFTDTYTYNGGNLLIGVYIVTKGSYTGNYNNYKPLYYGEEVSGASIGGTSATQQNFLPKTTFTYQAPAACPKPTLSNVASEDITATSAIIRWTPSNPNQEYFDIYYSTENTAPTELTTPSYSNVIGISKKIEGLSPATIYYVWLRGNCGTPASPDISGGWTASKDFQTECGTIASGSWGFETPNTGGTTSYPLPACWTRPTTGASAYYPQSYTYGTPRTGSYHLYFYSSSSATTPVIGVLPEIEGGVNGKRLSLYEKGAYSFSIGYMTDPADASTFVAVLTETGSSSYSASPYIVDFGEYTGNPSYIAIKANFTSTYQTLYIDDVTLSDSPNCLEPTITGVTGITTSTASLSWEAGNAGQDHWDIYYSKSSTEPTNETTPTITNTNQNPYPLEGLESGTDYYVWVRGNCGGDHSGWSSVYNFQTECEDVATFPWNENFEGFNVNTVPACWDNTASTSPDITSNPHYIWGVYSYSDNKMIRMNNYNAHTGTALINSPEIVLPATPAYELSFEYSHTASCGAFKVKISEDGGTTFTEVGSYTKGTGSSYSDPGTFTEADPIPLASYAGKTVIIQFYSEANYGQGAIFVDNISIDLAPACSKPSGLMLNTPTARTAHTATLKWTNGSTDQDAWQIAYSTNADFNPDEVTPVDVNTNPATLEGLTANTQYYAYVRANCGSEDGMSAWCNNKATFTTTVGNAAPTALACPAATIDKRSAVINWTGVATNDNHASYDLYYDLATVTTVPDEPTAPNFIPGITETTKTLNGLNPATAYKVWVRDNCGSDGYSAWTSPVTFATLVACPAPTGLTVSEIKPTSAQVSWNGDASSYNLRYRASTAFTYGFETAEPWAVDDFAPCTTYDGDGGTTYAIENVTFTNQNYVGACIAFQSGEIAGYESHNGNAFGLMFNTVAASAPNDDWFILPELTIADGDVFSFWAREITSNYGPEIINVGVYGTTAGTFASTLEENLEINETTWTKHTYDLTAYVGQTIKLAINCVSNDVFGFMFDDIFVGDPNPSTWDEVLEDVTSPCPLALTEETNYEVQVQSVCGGEDGESAWSLSVAFATPSACDQPVDLDATVLHESASLSWTGYQTSYNVRYRTAAYNDTYLEEGFEDPDEFANWQAFGVVTTNTGSNRFGRLSDAARTGSYGFSFSSYSQADDYNQYLISPEITNTGKLEFYYKNTSSGYAETFKVGYASKGNTVDDFAWGSEISISNATWTKFSEDIPDGTKYIAIHYYSNYQYQLYIDDMVVLGSLNPAGEWQEDNEVTSPYLAEGLTANKDYEWQVQGVCTSATTDWSEGAFTTLNNNQKVFVTAGNWNEAGNWSPSGAPAATNDVILRANVTIPNGVVAEAKTIVMEGTPTPTITVKSGGQLKNMNNAVKATMEKAITGYGTGNDKWYLISTSLSSSIAPTNDNVQNVISATAEDYDLFKFVGSSTTEWKNYKQSSFNLVYGQGYLYANKEDVTLSFTGTVPAYNNMYYAYGQNHLTYNTSNPYGTVNLVGNMLSANAALYYYKNSTTTLITDYYKMNAAGTEVALSEDEFLAPNEGAIIAATASYQYVVIAPYVASGSKVSNPALNIAVSSGKDKVDVARVRFGEGEKLTKYQINANHTKLYIPQDDNSYAVVYTEAMGEMPLNFKAETAGQYTISMKLDGANLGYLHLYDKITGEDVNLFTTPEYSFVGSPRDMEDRFIIRFSESSFNETFAYQNGDEIIVNGEGTLQVFDVMGRFVGNYNVNGNTRISASQFSNAVYIFRLVGDDVKTQKIVVR